MKKKPECKKIGWDTDQEDNISGNIGNKERNDKKPGANKSCDRHKDTKRAGPEFAREQSCFFIAVAAHQNFFEVLKILLNR
jgi:hypothetical protein